jgi:hypothetical protein
MRNSGRMDYTAYFQDLADYYNNSRIHCKKITDEGRFNAACHINFMNHLPRELLPVVIDELHRRLEPDSIVFCASQRFEGSAEEPWYEKAETGDMVSLRHHNDGRAIEVVDTLFTQDLLRELLGGKTRDLQITLKPWWWWASYRVA